MTVLAWCAGNADAAAFLQSAYTVAQVWDDVVDEGASPDADAALHWLSTGRDIDPFYAIHRAVLFPVMMTMEMDWRVANAFEAEAVHFDKAYVLRAGWYRLAHVVAMLCGGELHSREYGPKIWAAYGETLSGLRAEFSQEATCPIQLQA